MNKFVPSDLKENVIRGLFGDSLATRDSKRIIRCILFQKENGFPNDSKTIFFDGDIINEIKPTIELITGQLKAVHDGEKTIDTYSAKVLYTGSLWTENQSVLLSYLHLALAAGVITPINAQTGDMSLVKDIFPTILSSEENYYQWTVENRKRLIAMFNDGQEPDEN